MGGLRPSLQRLHFSLAWLLRLLVKGDGLSRRAKALLPGPAVFSSSLVDTHSGQRGGRLRLPWGCSPLTRRVYRCPGYSGYPLSFPSASTLANICGSLVVESLGILARISLVGCA